MDCVTKKYFAFSGRAGRSEFWFYMLFYIIIVAVLNILAAVTGHTDADTGIKTPNTIFSLLGALVSLALLLPSLGVSVRRLHDTNRSGWWILIGLVPFVGGIILLVFYIMDSTPGPNQFGPNPRDAQVGAMASA